MWLDSKAVNCPQKWGNFNCPFFYYLGFFRRQMKRCRVLVVVNV